MNALVSDFKQRLTGRADSEHEQAFIRLAILTVVLMYLLYQEFRYPESASGQVLPLVAIGFVVGAFIVCWLLRLPGISHPRRVLGMLADYGLMTVAMVVGGEQLAWIYVVLMWVTVGNGLRFGKTYLYAAMVMAATSFSLVLFRTPYWHENLGLGFGLLAGLIAIPLYLSSLLRTLNKATEEARRANEAKTRFLANMSHEFRTPLNGITGMSQVLAMTSLNDEQQECVSTIQASSRTLLELMEDALDISAIEAGKFKLKLVDFDLSELLEEVEKVVLPGVNSKSITYESHIAVGVPTQLRGDAGHLRQVLLNLVGNAVKFTDDGFVAVQVTRIADDNLDQVHLRFEVSDSGMGIPASALTTLFDAFEQVDSGIARRHGGSGLGTTIAKGLIEAMGGHIQVESTLGAGSRFWFDLTFKPGLEVNDRRSMQPDGQAASGTAVGLSDTLANTNVLSFHDPFLRHRARVEPRRILVADDHVANRMVLERVLEKAGHQVISVQTGEALLDLSMEVSHDLIITDLHMPDFSGLDLIQQLRIMEAGSNTQTPVIVFSADVTPEAIKQCRDAGAYAFLAKPLVVDRLLEAIASLGRDKGFADAKTGKSISPETSLDSHVNWEFLDDLRAFGMGPDFEAEFLRQCKADAQRCVENLHEAGLASQWTQMRDQAHALKGVVGNIGLVRVAKASSAIMSRSDWQLATEWEARSNELKSLLKNGLDALNSRPKDHSQSHEKDGANT